MSVADRSSKRMKGDGPMGGPIPPEGYYGQPPPGGRYPPYGAPGGPQMGPQSGYLWQQGHAPPPPPHSWGHGSPTPPGSMYAQRGGPSMTPDRSGYSAAYPRGPPPPMQGAGGGHRGAKTPGSSSRQTGKSLDGPPNAPPGPPDVPAHQQGYQGGYYPPPQAPYGSSPYPPSGPPTMHHPSSYGNPPPPSMYGTTPPRSSQTRPRASPELMGAYSPGPVICQTTHTDNPDLDAMYSRGLGLHDDDGNGSIGGGGNSKDKGRGSYKCGRCGVPKKGHVCPYQPKLTRRPGEPLPEMRSACIQVEMDEFMTLRRLNLRIQGFPESYASEAYGDDMVVGEPHPHPPRTVNSPSISHGGDMMTVDGPPPLPSQHDPVVGVLGSPIRSSPIGNDPISAV